jgi:carbon-monoxide dehydrogenase large subunit
MAPEIKEYKWEGKPEGQKYIGVRNNKNPDAVGVVTGAMEYVQDMTMSGMLYARMKTSTVAHAKIKSIDTSAAKAMPGVAAVLTADDIPDVRMFGDEPVVARGKVMYYMEPVALVAAETPEIAEAALEKIKVEYEELPVGIDIEAMASANPPTVLHSPKLVKSRFLDEHPNMINATIGIHGDADKGFTESDAIVEGKWDVARFTHTTAGPNGAITWIDPADGRLNTMEETQSLFQNLYPVFAGAMNMSMSKVRARSPRRMSGAYGNRSYVHVSSRIGWLTLKTGRPVKMVLTRDEATQITCRPRWRFYFKVGCKKDGTLTSGKFTVYEANGGYGRFGAGVVRNAYFQFTGNWRFPNFRYDSFAAYTNETPMQNLHTFAHQEVCFAVNQAMDMLAEKIGMDKYQFKRMNLLVNDELNIADEIVRSGAVGALDLAAKYINWSQPKASASAPWKRGRAIDVGNVYINPLVTKPLVHVRLNSNPGCEIFASIHDLGTQINATAGFIAAEVLKIPLENIVVTSLDTDHTVFSGSAYANQQAFAAGTPLMFACQDALQKMYLQAAPLLKAKPEDLDTKDGMIFVKGKPDTALPWSNFMQGTTPFILGVGEAYFPLDSEDVNTMKCLPQACPIEVDPSGKITWHRLNLLYMYAASAIELLVNEDTGQVIIEKFVNISDTRPLNVWACDQQLEMAQNYLGAGLYTQMIQDQTNGAYLATTHLENKWPSSLDVLGPSNCIVDHAVSPGRISPFGIEKPWPSVWGPWGGGKGISEATIVNCQCTIANALTDALGVRFYDVPIEPRKILQALGKA